MNSSVLACSVLWAAFSFSTIAIAQIDRVGLRVSADSGVELCWGTDPNLVYQVQSAESLSSDEDWHNLGRPLEGTGQSVCFSDSRSLTAMRFYRVPSLPNDSSVYASATATVAIHISAATDQGWATLGGPHSAWKYWHIYGLLMEQLRSDGTPFVIVSDSDIACGRLVITDSDIAADVAAGRSPRRRGTPKYAILFSLANTCASDDVPAGIDSFVLAGGHAVVGSTSWTRDGACQARALAPYVPEGSASAPRVLATAQNEFPGYPASASTDDDCNSLWLNAIDDQLPTWIQYRFERPDGGIPTIAKVALVHSTYEERGFGYTYRIADYQVQISVDPDCAEGTFSTVAAQQGNDINREYQVICFRSPQPARCVRIVARSSHETKPFQGYDVTQWVGLAGFQAFDQNGNALIRTACVAGNPWRPLGLRPLQVDGTFDHIQLKPDGIADQLLSHFEPDFKMRGYRLAESYFTTGGFNQWNHWGQAVVLETPSGEPSATILAVDPDPAQSEKPIFARRQRGKGRYIYSASFNSLAGWTMHCSPAYVYGVYRHAVDEAHRATGLPNVRLGAWPWPYAAGFMTRHDHYPHFGWNLAPGPDLEEDTLVARIERYKDALIDGQTPRDFPVRGGFFLLNEGTYGLPDGTGPCAEGPDTCNSEIRAVLDELIVLGAEIGTHAYKVGTQLDGFSGERAKLRAYIGSKTDPGIYVSHGAFAHFDNDNYAGSGWVGIETMVASNVVAKGEDAFGAHPHFALKISSANQYGIGARWPVVEIPATGYATEPSPQQWPPNLGVISHEIMSDPWACTNDSTPPRSCMEKAVDFVYKLGGIINIYDHIGNQLPGQAHLYNPTPEQFDAYINYAQGLPYVYTTSTRDIVGWWNLRDGIGLSRTVTHATVQGGMQVTLRISVSAASQDQTRRFGIEVDLPSASTGDPTVTVGGQTLGKCPNLPSGTQLKGWLASPAVVSGCYVRSGSRIRIPAPAPSIIVVTWTTTNPHE